MRIKPPGLQHLSRIIIAESGRQELSPEGSLSVSDTNRCDPHASGTLWAQRTLGEVGPLLTIREVAERLRVCRATVYRMVAEGRLPAVRVSSGAIRVVETPPQATSR
jgi:excisionase family DNA binding protein